MSTYLWILADDRPFVIGVDENNRTIFSVNVRARTQGDAADWMMEIIQHLNDSGVACVFGVDTFVGPAADIPSGEGPYIQINDTGGFEPTEAQGGENYDNLAAQVTVRATDYDLADAKIRAIWKALDGTRNTTVTV